MRKTEKERKQAILDQMAEDRGVDRAEHVPYLQLLLQAYAAGEDHRAEVADNIVAEFRPLLRKGDTGPNFDGPLYARIVDALRAAESYGRTIRLTATGIDAEAVVRYNALETNDQGFATQGSLWDRGDPSGRMSKLSEDSIDHSGRICLLRSGDERNTGTADSDVGRGERTKGTEYGSETGDSNTAGLQVLLLRADVGVNDHAERKDYCATDALGSRPALRLRERQSGPEFRGSLSRLQSDQTQQDISDGRGGEDLHQCPTKSERLSRVENANSAGQDSLLSGSGNTTAQTLADGKAGLNEPTLSAVMKVKFSPDELQRCLFCGKEYRPAVEEHACL